MSARRRHRRVTVVRGRRRYQVCGVQDPPSRIIGRLVAWVPSATLVVTILASLYALERPLPPRPAVAVSPYSIEDFARTGR